MVKKLEKHLKIRGSHVHKPEGESPKNEKGFLDGLLKNENLMKLMVAAMVVSVAMILWGKGITAEAPAVKTTPQSQGVESSQITALEKALESKLAENLRQMQGVGQVRVTVTLASGIKSDYAKNESITKRTTEETDKAGGVRKSTETTENDQLVMPNGVAQPVVIMEESPAVAGVLVIAEGAKEAKVREGIHNAVRTLLNIPTNKITVEAMGGI